MSKTTLLPPQPSLNATPSSQPIPYTGSPLRLCAFDISLFFKNAWSIPGILHPVRSAHPTPLDELYPSLANLLVLFLHGILIVIETGFLVSLVGIVLVPVWLAVLWIAGAGGIIWGVSRILNGNGGTGGRLRSQVELREEELGRSRGECWVYLNGVSIGHHWMQSNLDRLSHTFRRPIIGVHNQTYGFIFDLLQCIIERDFCWATTDIRSSYAVIREKLLNQDYNKVILILHSQGGVEGGLILDWLLSELPQDIIHKLEIYTFASAANHFNNPPRHAKSTHSAFASSSSSSSNKDSAHANAVRYIEHYANDGEFVARWGVITFARMENRYMGRLFIRLGSGHLLNQHYLMNMFPLDQEMKVLEHNEFMDMPVEFPSNSSADQSTKEADLETLLNGGRTATVKDFSRLWCYRNGMTPLD